MRLFITTFSQTSNELQLREERVLKHARVLRLSSWDTILVQEPNASIRYTCSITNFTQDFLQATILDTQKSDEQHSQVSMVICTPNSSDKLHTIVQKLSEIWVSTVSFRHSNRSQWMKVNEKKLEKLHKISLEAIEQSNGWMLPEISVIKDIEYYLKEKHLIIFDQTWESFSSTKTGLPVCWIIGPEWWFSDQELNFLESQNHSKISLWNTILRTETASIVAGWMLVNGY